MKIVHLMDFRDSELVLEKIKKLSVRLDGKSIESLVICMAPNDVALKSEQGVFYFKKASNTGLIEIWKLLKLVKKNHGDILHTHGINSLKAGAWMSRIGRLKSIHTIYGHHYTYFTPFIWKSYRKIITATSALKESLRASQRIPLDNIRVVYDGLDDAQLNQNAPSKDEKKLLRRQLGLRPEGCLIGNIGALSAEQDQATLLKMLRKLRKKEESVQLAIFGNGPKEIELLKLAKEYGLENDFKIINPESINEHVPSIIDILVISAFVEQESKLFFEAMAKSIPIIATQIGSHTEYIDPRKTGYLVPCGFPERIESSVKMLLAIDNLISQTGKSARKRAQEMFSLRSTTETIMKVYAEI